MGVVWSESVDEILDGDHAVMLVYATPAAGAVLAPVSNFGLHDRKAGIVTVNSSVGAWKKLDRIRRNPQVALAFHTRAHATHGRPEYVLVQGRASLAAPVPDYPSTVLDNWERLEPWRDLASVWKRWLSVYALRVEIRVAVERMIVWPDLACGGAATVQGLPLSAQPQPQDEPAKGTAPRLDQARAARLAGRLPHALAGWIGGDGFPMAIPVGITGSEERGIRIEGPFGLLPPGGRRAGLTAHWFSRGVVGQRQAIHTGWMEGPLSAGGPATYAPHTRRAYRMPSSRLVYRTAVGLATRLGYRQARRAGAAGPSHSESPPQL